MENESIERYGSISGSIFDEGGSHSPIKGALIGAYPIIESPPGEKSKKYTLPPKETTGLYAWSDEKGAWFIPKVLPGKYQVWAEFMGKFDSEVVEVEPGCNKDACFHIPVNLRLSLMGYEKGDCGKLEPRDCVFVSHPAVLRIGFNEQLKNSVRTSRVFSSDHTTSVSSLAPNSLDWQVICLNSGLATASGTLVGLPPTAIHPATPPPKGKGPPEITASTSFPVAPTVAQPIAGKIGVTLSRTAAFPTRDQALWVAIRNRTKAVSFSGSGYKDFIDRVLCQREALPSPSPVLTRQLDELGTQVYGVGAYQLLKTATEIFLLLECGVAINPTGALDDEELLIPEEEAGRLGESQSLEQLQERLRLYLGPGQLPYITRVINAAFPGLPIGNLHCDNVLSAKADSPCLLELIWSYWHEEGMLVQTLGAITQRFQNLRGSGDRDPLAHLEIDPLRPLNNILWGYIQDEQNRLTVRRRTYEYDHEYGLALYGKAVPRMRSADSRSKFLEGFHNLLNLASVFFKEDNDTTVIADGFPLLNALKEVHLTMAHGAHNQFGDLPWTARAEMLMQEWILARPEMRDFLQSRAMVPYKEAWMPQVDTMKTLQGWSDVTVTHFRDLGVYGEQILLSIRYADWIDVNDEDSAKNWARYWRPEIQSYLHAYRAVTGIDLTNPDTVDATMPAIHLQKRLAIQQRAR